MGKLLFDAKEFKIIARRREAGNRAKAVAIVEEEIKKRKDEKR